MKDINSTMKTLIVLAIGALMTVAGIQSLDQQIEKVINEANVSFVNYNESVNHASGTDVSNMAAAVEHNTYTDISESTQWHYVLSVIDGDTIKVSIDGKEETVRIIGIDTPETKRSRIDEECFGEDAGVYAKALLENTLVQIKHDDTQRIRDRYNRLLAFVGMYDGRDFGEVMIINGYAHEFIFQGRVHKKQQLYKDAQTQAQENKVGLWAEGACF